MSQVWKNSLTTNESGSLSIVMDKQTGTLQQYFCFCGTGFFQIFCSFTTLMSATVIEVWGGEEGRRILSGTLP